MLRIPTFSFGAGTIPELRNGTGVLHLTAQTKGHVKRKSDLYTHNRTDEDCAQINTGKNFQGDLKKHTELAGKIM